MVSHPKGTTSLRLAGWLVILTLLLTLPAVAGVVTGKVKIGGVYAPGVTVYCGGNTAAPGSAYAPAVTDATGTYTFTFNNIASTMVLTIDPSTIGTSVSSVANAAAPVGTVRGGSFSALVLNSGETGVPAGGTVVPLNDVSGFHAGDWVAFEHAGAIVSTNTIASVDSTAMTITLTSGLSAGVVDFDMAVLVAAGPGSTVIPVVSTTGLSVGMPIRFYHTNPLTAALVLVASSAIAAVDSGANTITLTSALTGTLYPGDIITNRISAASGATVVPVSNTGSFLMVPNAVMTFRRNLSPVTTAEIQSINHTTLTTVTSMAAKGQPIVSVASTSGMMPNQQIEFFNGSTWAAAGTIRTVDNANQITLTANLTADVLEAATVVTSTVTLKAPLSAALMGGDDIRITQTPYARLFVPITVTAAGVTVPDKELLTTGDVTGKIYDAITGYPISGASVSCAGVSATSGADGSYTLTAVPGGVEQNVVASAPGYLPGTMGKVLPAATDIDIYLNPSTGIARSYWVCDGYNGTSTKDTALVKSLPNNNYGAWPLLPIGISDANNARRQLLQWDLSSASIPSNAWVRSASVHLRRFKIVGAGGSSYLFNRYTMVGYPAENEWAEGIGAGYTNAVPGANWTNYTSSLDTYGAYVGQPWSVPGGGWESTDPVIMTGNTYGTQTPGNAYILSATSAARQWVADPASNTGVLLKLTTDDIVPGEHLQYNLGHMATREGIDGSAFRPTLRIDAVVPSPGKALIRGLVTDRISGDPLEGAVVDLGGGITATADDSGFYAVEVDAGTYSATASYPNYTSRTSGVTVAANENIGVDFQLNGTDGRVTYVFQEGLNNFHGTKDGFLNENAPIMGYNGNVNTRLGFVSATPKSLRPTFWFDTSRIPTTASVINAKLELTTTLGPTTGHTVPVADVPFKVYRLTRDWKESATTGTNNLGSTWNYYDGVSGGTWTTPGGDYDPTVVTSATVPALTPAGTRLPALDVTSAAAVWVTNPSNNAGVILVPDASSVPKEAVFATRESSIATEGSVAGPEGYRQRKPKLTVVVGGIASTYSTSSTFVKGGRWNLVSVPADPVNPDPLEVFNGIDVANASFQYWKNNTEGGGYQSYGPLFGWTGPIERGIPYWFLEATVTTDKQVSFLGIAPTTDFELTIPSRTAAPFWVMFGTPFNSTVLADNIRFKNVTKRGDTWLTWEQAFSETVPTDRIVDSNAQGWSAADNRFVSVTPTAFIGEYHQIDPWWGYWLLVYDANELKIKFPKP